MFKASLDNRSLERSLKKLTKDLNKTAEQTITEMAQIGGRQLAHVIEPYGLGEKAKEISEKAIYKDVHRAYDYVGQTYNALRKISQKIAIAFSNAVRNNDFTAAERYARKYLPGFEMRHSDSGNHLEKVRGPRGRVPASVPVMGISNSSDLDGIKEQKKLTAGLAKAGWLQAAKNISSKTRVPSWLRKKQNVGYAKKASSGWNFSVTLYNTVRYASALTTGAKKMQAVRWAYRNQVKRMERQLNAITSKF